MAQNHTFVEGVCYEHIWLITFTLMQSSTNKYNIQWHFTNIDTKTLTSIAVVVPRFSLSVKSLSAPSEVAIIFCVNK